MGIGKELLYIRIYERFALKQCGRRRGIPLSLANESGAHWQKFVLNWLLKKSAWIVNVERHNK